MEVQKRPVADLVPDPNNARKHDQKNLDAIKGSLAKFGQQTERFFSRVTLSETGCFDFSETQPHTGYGKFQSNGRTWRAHRWVMWALGNIEINDPICVLHVCDNRKCVNPNHLYLGDRLQNAKDIKDRNRTHLIRDPKTGSKNPQSKLDEKTVAQIKELLACGISGVKISEDFKISRSVVSEIKNKKLWTHV